jgi:hypothetical protein
MIEPKPADEPAALEELPAGIGAGAGSGAGAGFAPPGVEIPSLPLVSPREAAEASEAEAAMTAPAIVEPAIGDGVSLATASCRSPPLGGCPTFGDDPVELEGALSTALQSAAPLLASTAARIGPPGVTEPAVVGTEPGPEGLWATGAGGCEGATGEPGPSGVSLPRIGPGSSVLAGGASRPTIGRMGSDMGRLGSEIGRPTGADELGDVGATIASTSPTVPLASLAVCATMPVAAEPSPSSARAGGAVTC